MQIDEYGFEASSVFFHRRKLKPYILLKEGDITYCCFRNTPKRCIHRITKTDDMTKVEWSFGEWEDRATLSYIPINETMEVTCRKST